MSLHIHPIQFHRSYATFALCSLVFFSLSDRVIAQDSELILQTPGPAPADAGICTANQLLQDVSLSHTHTPKTILTPWSHTEQEPRTPRQGHLSMFCMSQAPETAAGRNHPVQTWGLESTVLAALHMTLCNWDGTEQHQAPGILGRQGTEHCEQNPEPKSSPLWHHPPTAPYPHGIRKQLSEVSGRQQDRYREPGDMQ